MAHGMCLSAQQDITQFHVKIFYAACGIVKRLDCIAGQGHRSVSAIAQTPRILFAKVWN
jgi:hypothetical protein